MNPLVKVSWPVKTSCSSKMNQPVKTNRPKPILQQITLPDNPSQNKKGPLWKQKAV